MDDIVGSISKALGNKKFKKLKIFVINTQADKQLATDLIAMLRKKGFRCWDGKNCILPGQLHNNEQEKALSEANIVLGLMSRSTTITEGRYTFLLKVALEVQKEKPAGTIFFIPVLIDGCDLPFEFKKYRALDLTIDGAADKLVGSIQRRSDIEVIEDEKKPQAIWK